jgi:hypothetical protein
MIKKVEGKLYKLVYSSEDRVPAVMLSMYSTKVEDKLEREKKPKKSIFKN